MKIQYYVCAVAEREHRALALCEKLPGAIILVDNPRSGTSWTNYRKALTLPTDAAWIVSVDDDAVLHDEFDRRLRERLEGLNEDFATFYLSSKSMTSSARRYGAGWIATWRIVHGICWAIRVEAAKEAVEVAERHVRSDYYSGDQRLQTWLLATRRKNFIALPNLVDHAQGIPSTLIAGKHNDGRHSAWFDQHGFPLSAGNEVWHDERVSRKQTIIGLAARGMFRDNVGIDLAGE